MIPAYLEDLNHEQREAVLHEGKSLLILAGAGSGKTRVITTRIAYLIRERGYAPRSILAVTFTNKAAKEMAARARRIDERAGETMLRTFHSFGAWFLRRNAAFAGISPGFVIYDDDDAAALLGTIRENASRVELRGMAALISKAKDYFLSPGDPELDRIDHRPEFRAAYALYEEKLKKTGNVDFGDLIKKPVEILRNNPGLTARVQERFSVIMVDEYQDSNTAQFKLLCELKGETGSLCVVGDDDQSIYRFRGAEVKNILEFPNQFPGTSVIRLERNYRSFAPILTLASSVVDHNRGRLGKTLRAERGGGKTPVLAFLPDQDEEAAFCAELITRSLADKAGDKVRCGDWAILYRTNAQSLTFETELLRRRIPYRVVGSLKFYEREEIKDALALLALIVNPLDEVAFRRVVNKPSRGIGGSSVEKIIAAAGDPAFSTESPGGGKARAGDLFNFETPVLPGFLGAAGKLELPAKAAAGIETFAAVFDRARSALSGKRGRSGRSRKKNVFSGAEGEAPELKAGEGLSACVTALILDSGLQEYHRTRDDSNGYQRTGNLQELINAASLYRADRNGLLEFLEHIELDRSIEGNDSDSQDAVTLITLHNTKGLEFPRVILTGLEQGVFPRDDKSGDELEEERRLFYVGVTRAMDELYLSSCARRRMYGRTSPMLPSLFLHEADKSALRIIGGAPAGFGRRGLSAGREPAGKISSDGHWRLGERIFNDDHGYGHIAGMEESEDGPVIKVRFENGYETRFLSETQSSRFEKTSED